MLCIPSRIQEPGVEISGEDAYDVSFGGSETYGYDGSIRQDGDNYLMELDDDLICIDWG